MEKKNNKKENYEWDGQLGFFGQVFVIFTFIVWILGTIFFTDLFCVSCVE